MQKQLEQFLSKKTGKDVVVSHLKLLAGGAIQENWFADIEVDGELIEAVVRCDAASSVSDSWSRPQEFALLQVAFEAGVCVPEPLWLGEHDVLGRDFFIMRRARGVAPGFKLVRDLRYAPDREALVYDIGVQMAKLHALHPPQPRLDFLSVPTVHPAQLFIDESREWLDRYPTAYPALEWGLRWLEQHRPAQEPLALVHRDFRTGNYMVDEQGLTAILDWEFAAWSQPLEDLGWFCARCWRFGQFDDGKSAGGMGSYEALFAGYQSESGRQVTREELFYWEVFAHARWAMIAIKQGERHISGQEPSLELALTAHIVPELELQILRMTGIDYAYTA